MSDAPAPAPVTDNGVPPVTQETVVDEVPGFKVFAGNLAYSTTDEGLKAFFEPVKSDILSAQVILRGTRSAGYGFVALATEAAAHKAVELLNKSELDGRPIIVEVAKLPEQKEKKPKPAKKRTNRRGDKAVPGEVTEAEANGEVADKTDAEAAPASDEAAKPKKKKKYPRKNKKKAAEGEEAVTDGALVPAIEAAPEAGDSAATGEKKPKVKKPRVQRPRRPAGEDPVGEPSKTMLFVANLGFDMEDAGLEALFKDAGLTVNSARVVRRRFGKPRKSKGYGFVDVGSEAEQKKAIEALQGKDVGGRQIAVKVAVDAQIADEDKEDAEGATPADTAVVVAT